MRIKKKRVKKRGESYCPYIKDCGHRVPRNYFAQICNTQAYRNCRHYASKAGELNKPIEWLQKLAVEQAKKESGVKKREIGT